MRRFAASTGDTPAHYVLARRLEAVCRDLDDTALMLKGIARRAGFRSEQSMRRACACARGTTPEAYRAARAPPRGRPAASPPLRNAPVLDCRAKKRANRSAKPQ